MQVASGQLLIATLFVSFFVLWVVYELLALCFSQRTERRRRLIEEIPLQGSESVELVDEDEASDTVSTPTMEEEIVIENTNQFATKLFVLRRLMVLGVILVVIFLSENMSIFNYEVKKYNRDTFLGLIALFGVVAYLTVKTLKSEEEEELEREKCNLLINRDQTEEWKGWMQFVFIMYHYFRSEESYDVIRVLVSSYVWMTGFGNFSFFYIRKDYSISRLLQMLWRLNFMVVMLCLALNNSYMFYYIVPLHTTFFLVVYGTMFIYHKYNTNHYFIRLKLILLGVLLWIIWEIPGFLKITLTLFGLWDESVNIHEFRFRTYLDHYSCLFGMIFALTFPVLREWLRRVNSEKFTRIRWALYGFTIATVVTILSLWGYFVVYRSENKFVYNSLHPYFVMIPIGGYLFLRNLTPRLRNRYSVICRYLGKITLETYLLQHHLFMSKNVTKLLVLVPGYPLVNFTVVGIVFIVCSKILFNITMDLRSVFIPGDEESNTEHDNNFKLLRNICLLTGSAGFLLTYTYVVQALNPFITIVFGGVIVALVFFNYNSLEKEIERRVNKMGLIIYAIAGLLVPGLTFIVTHTEWIIRTQTIGKGFVGNDMLLGLFCVLIAILMLLQSDSYGGLLTESMSIFSEPISIDEVYRNLNKQPVAENDKDREHRSRSILFRIAYLLVLVATISVVLARFISIPATETERKVVFNTEIVGKCSAEVATSESRLFYSSIPLSAKTAIASGHSLQVYVKPAVQSVACSTAHRGKLQSQDVMIPIFFEKCGSCYCANIQLLDTGSFEFSVSEGHIPLDLTPTNVTDLEKFKPKQKFIPVHNLDQFVVDVIGDKTLAFKQVRNARPIGNIFDNRMKEFSFEGRWYTRSYFTEYFLSSRNDEQTKHLAEWAKTLDENMVFVPYGDYYFKGWESQEGLKCMNDKYKEFLWFGDSNTKRIVINTILGENSPCRHKTAECGVRAWEVEFHWGALQNKFLDIRFGDTIEKPDANKFNLETGPLMHFYFIDGMYKPTRLDHVSQYLSMFNRSFIAVSVGNWDIRSTIPEWEKNVEALARLLEAKNTPKVPLLILPPNYSDLTIHLDPYFRKKMKEIGGIFLDTHRIGAEKGGNDVYTNHYPHDRIDVIIQMMYNLLCN